MTKTIESSGYSVSDSGVVTNRRGKRLSGCVSQNGYRRVCIQVGKQRVVPIHRLVALAFIPKVEGCNEVNHKNGIKEDNRAENLEWVTGSENIRHAVESGLLKIGSSHYRAKLTEDDVRAIRAIPATVPNPTIARLFGVSRRTILGIRNGETWRHVELTE